MFHILLLCEFYSVALPTRAHLCIYFLLPATTGKSLFLLSGRSRSPTRNLSSCVFANKSIGSCKYVFIPIPSLNPPSISKSFSDSTVYLSATLAILPILPSTSALYLPNFPADIKSSWFPPICPSMFSQLRYPTLFQLALLWLSPIQLYQLYGWQPLSWYVPHFISLFQLPHVYWY